jgi:hypothetical protein
MVVVHLHQKDAHILIYLFIYLFIIQYSQARLDSCLRQEKPKRRFCLLHKLVPPPPAGLIGVRRSGDPVLCMVFLIKVVFPN